MCGLWLGVVSVCCVCCVRHVCCAGLVRCVVCCVWAGLVCVVCVLGGWRCGVIGDGLVVLHVRGVPVCVV